MWHKIRLLLPLMIFTGVMMDTDIKKDEDSNTEISQSLVKPKAYTPEWSKCPFYFTLFWSVITPTCYSNNFLTKQPVRRTLAWREGGLKHIAAKIASLIQWVNWGGRTEAQNEINQDFLNSYTLVDTRNKHKMLATFLF